MPVKARLIKAPVTLLNPVPVCSYAGKLLLKNPVPANVLVKQLQIRIFSRYANCKGVRLFFMDDVLVRNTFLPLRIKPVTGPMVPYKCT